MTKTPYKDNNEGFTLVEMIVAIGIFLIVITVSMGALINLYNANNKSQSLAAVTDSLNYSLESMAKTIRFANNYHCGDASFVPLTTAINCSSNSIGLGGTEFSVSTSSLPTSYKLNGGKIEVAPYGGDFSSITPASVTIQYLRFYVFNTPKFSDGGPGSLEQPYVIIVLKGYAGTKASNESSFVLQTTVSQRPLDL
jgi:prepilin-type N-terminal cleavage/methylation domain-containing protein